MLRLLSALLLIAVPITVQVATFGVAQAQDAADCTGPCDPPRVPDNPSIDPKFELLRHALSTRGAGHPIFGPDGAGDVRTDGVAATLKLHRHLSPVEIRTWERRGIEWMRHDDDQLVEIGLVYGAFVPFDLVDQLAELPLVRAEVAWQPPAPRPIETTGEIAGADAVRMRPDGFDGSGCLVVDIDSSVDVLHPQFFRADAGRFDWIDTNGSGAFEPGADGVDLDGDGAMASRERLLVLDAAFVDFADDAQISNDDGVVQADRDWLFADLNGDGRRNAGTAAGFTEEDPAYGEPIFVVEDVDRDGVLEPGEALFMLGTSKVVEIVSAERTWRRGRDLIEAADAELAQRAFHGTGVASILLGGQPAFHSQTSVAPGAEIVVHSARDEAAATLQDVPQLRAIDAAVRLRADVVLHEWTNPYTVQHDGSTNLNAAMDAARRADIAQVTPVGNMNLSGKHIQAPFEPGSSTRLTFEVGADGFETFGGETRPYTIAYMSLFFRNNLAPTVELIMPNGTSTFLQPGGEPLQLQDTIFAATTVETSDRGTTHIFVTIFNDADDQPLPAGNWDVVLDEAQQSDEVWGRIADFYSGWSVGIAWTNPTTDSGTIVYPATADSAFGIGAHAGVVVDAPDTIGGLRDYSGRGPRIDGARGLDITAPDDPIAALAGTESTIDRGFGRSWFGRFGGTSGAAPHVAGTIALLREQDASRDADELERLITASADTSDLDGASASLPNDTWGFGRLDVHSTLFGEPAPQNAPPRATASFTERGIDASASTDPDGDTLEYRFDVEHDGEWDTPWQSETSLDRSPAPGLYSRVEVRDEHGARAGVLLFKVSESSGDAGGDAGSDGGPVADPPGSDDGCCSTASGRSHRTPAALAILAFGLFLAQRRRAKRG